MQAAGAKRYGYANYILSLHIGRSPEETHDRANADTTMLMELGAGLGSPFNPDKSEVQALIYAKRFSCIPRLILIRRTMEDTHHYISQLPMAI